MTLPNHSTAADHSIQAEFAATFVDEWARSGIQDAVVSPGSRSGALALALLNDDRINVHMRLDERSGAFYAVGLALSSGSPVVIVTTSGTAVAEVHAAVVEADLARVALIVCSADRPVELHGVGAPQSINQANIFGGSVRYYVDLPVAEEQTRAHWRSFASRLVAEATTRGCGPGPVHANIAFREPMVGDIGPLPEGRPDGLPWHSRLSGPSVSTPAFDGFVGALGKAIRGLFIVGGNPLVDAQPILELAEQLGWPILGDARAIGRVQHPQLFAHADQYLRFDDVAEKLVPDLVVHIGSPHASKTLMTWNTSLASLGVAHLLVDPFGTFDDPERHGALMISADPVELCRQASKYVQAAESNGSWMIDWRACEDAAAAAIARELDDEQSWSEPGIARAIFAHLDDDATVFCSSSMPVRDVEWFAGARTGAPRVLANRGANGIDGVTSTMLGAAGGAPGRTVGITGDLAFFHDLSAFVWGSEEEVPQATLVVIDNSGGGIFSFLSYPDRVPRAIFERGFSTPQRPQITAVARGLGCVVRESSSLPELRSALDDFAAEPGISVIVCRTDRNENVAVHREVSEAVRSAALIELNKANRAAPGATT